MLVAFCADRDTVRDGIPKSWDEESIGGTWINIAAVELFRHGSGEKGEGASSDLFPASVAGYGSLTPDSAGDILAAHSSTSSRSTFSQSTFASSLFILHELCPPSLGYVIHWTFAPVLRLICHHHHWPQPRNRPLSPAFSSTTVAPTIHTYVRACSLPLTVSMHLQTLCVALPLNITVADLPSFASPARLSPTLFLRRAFFPARHQPSLPHHSPRTYQ